MNASCPRHDRHAATAIQGAPGGDSSPTDHGLRLLAGPAWREPGRRCAARPVLSSAMSRRNSFASRVTEAVYDQFI